MRPYDSIIENVLHFDLVPDHEAYHAEVRITPPNTSWKEMYEKWMDEIFDDLV